MWNTSYVYGFDNLSGWGHRYFFTYYNDFDANKSTLAMVLQMSVFFVTFLVSVITNCTIAFCVLRFPDMKTVTNSFVLNLAAADLLFAFTMPIVAYSQTTAGWQMGDMTCKLLPYTQFLAGIVLLWTLTLISMDRYRCIVVAPHRSKISNQCATICCTVIWLSTALASAPILLWFRALATTSGSEVCTIIFPRSERIQYSVLFVVLLIVGACLLPMLILVYNYQKIFQKILSTKSTWATSCVVVSTIQVPSKQARRQSEVSLTDIFVPWPGRKCSSTQTNPHGRHGSLTQHEEQRLNKHIKCVRLLLLNVLMVLLMWLPITIIMMLIYVDGSRPNEDTDFFLRSSHFVTSLTIAFLNTVVNPLLYGVLSENFRACLVQLCGAWPVSEDNNNHHAGKDNTITPTSGRTAPSVGLVNISAITVPTSTSSKNGREKKQAVLNSISDLN